MVLNKILEETDYKPKKRQKREEKTVNFKELIKNKTERQILELLVEGLTDPDPREVVIYGTYVKKHIASFIPTSREKRIQKTLEYLAKAIENFTDTYNYSYQLPDSLPQ